jgi:hypothetical protein
VDFLLELLADGILEIVLEFFTRTDGEAVAANAKRARQVGSILVVVACVALGLGLGFLWGWHVALTDQRTPPLTLWVSLIGSVLFAALAWTEPQRQSSVAGSRKSRVRPWTWPASQLWRVALVHLAGAAGVLWGFVSMLPSAAA